MASGIMVSPRSSSIRLRTNFVCSVVKKSFWSGKEGIKNHATTPDAKVTRPSMTYRNIMQAWCQTRNRTFKTPTKIHLQPGSFPLPSRRVQPYARIGPIPTAIEEIKVNAAILKARSMIQGEFKFRTVHRKHQARTDRKPAKAIRRRNPFLAARRNDNKCQPVAHSEFSKNEVTRYCSFQWWVQWWAGEWGNQVGSQECIWNEEDADDQIETTSLC